MNPTNHYVFSGLTNCPVDTYDKLFNLPDLISSSVQWGNTINLTGLLWRLNKMIYNMYLAQCLTCHDMLFIQCQHARAQAGTRKRNCSVRTNETWGENKKPLRIPILVSV